MEWEIKVSEYSGDMLNYSVFVTAPNVFRAMSKAAKMCEKKYIEGVELVKTARLIARKKGVNK